MKTDSRLSKGFSLTEVLVTLSILFTLCILFLAVLVRARSGTKRTICLSNIRQLEIGMLSFVHDNDEIFPSTNDVQFVYWQYMGRYVGLNRPLWETDAKLFQCPSGFQLVRVKDSPWWTNSYDFNGWSTAWGVSPRVPSLAGKRLQSIKATDRTALLGEHSAFFAQSWHSPQRFAHTNALNVLGFVDGHVDFVKIYWNGLPGTADAPFNYDPIPGYEYNWSGN